MRRRKLGALLRGMIAVSGARHRGTVRRRQRQWIHDRPGSAMLDPVMTGVKIMPLLTVGDVLPSGYRFEAIPDGISVRPRGQGRVDLFVNHETSKVPFPYTTANPTAANGENDFDNSQVSRLILNQHSAGVLNGKFVITSSAGLPALLLELPRDEQGGIRPRHPLHERGVARLRASTGGLVAARAGKRRGEGDRRRRRLDVKTGKHNTISGMGRHNHENNVAIPGYEDLGRPLGRRHVHERPADWPADNFTLRD